MSLGPGLASCACVTASRGCGLGRAGGGGRRTACDDEERKSFQPCAPRPHRRHAAARGGPARRGQTHAGPRSNVYNMGGSSGTSARLSRQTHGQSDTPLSAQEQHQDTRSPQRTGPSGPARHRRRRARACGSPPEAGAARLPSTSRDAGRRTRERSCQAQRLTPTPPSDAGAAALCIGTGPRQILIPPAPVCRPAQQVSTVPPPPQKPQAAPAPLAACPRRRRRRPRPPTWVRRSMRLAPAAPAACRPAPAPKTPAAIAGVTKMRRLAIGVVQGGSLRKSRAK